MNEMVSTDEYHETLQRNGNENCLTEETTKTNRNKEEKWIWKMTKKIREDECYRQKWIYTICIYYAYFTLGALKMQLGPTFLDLMLIADVDLEDGSWIVTAFYIGYICGSILGGVIYKIINPVVLFSLALILLGMVIALIPWCFLFELMLLAHGVKGIGAGILAAIAIAELFRIWEVNATKYYIGLTLIFSTGSAISPLITEPFLIELNKGYSFRNTNVSSLNKSSINLSEIYNIPTDPSINTRRDFGTFEKQDSKVYFAYLLTTSVCLIGALIFLILFFVQKRKAKSTVRNKKTLPLTRNVRQLPVAIKVRVFIVTGLMVTLYGAIEESLFSFLPAFCVEYFSWSKTDGAFMTSLASICVTISRVISIFATSYIDARVVAGTLSIILFLDFLGFTLISIYKLDIGVWIFLGVFGLAKSSFFQLLVAITNEYFFPISGLISAFYLVSRNIGGALNPLLIGYVMEHISDLAFSYLFLIESSILLILVFINVLLSKYVVKNHGKTLNDVQIDVTETDKLEINRRK